MEKRQPVLAITPNAPRTSLKIFFYSEFNREPTLNKFTRKHPEAGVHGVSTTVLALVNKLNEQGYNAQVISGQNDHHFHFPIPGNPHLKVVLNSKRLLNRIKREKPDLVVGVAETPLGGAAIRKAKKAGIATIAFDTTNFGDYIRNNKRWPRRLRMFVGDTLDKRLPMRAEQDADMVRVSSEQALQKVQQWGIPGEKIFILRPGIDTQLFKRPKDGDANPYEKASWYKPDAKGNLPKIILYVGRVAQEKNYFDLLGILDTLPPNQHLVFAGPAGNKNDRKLLQKTEKEHPNFHWLNTIEHQDLPPYYQHANVMVTPSESETHGHTPSEAKATGTPVVVPLDGVMSRRIHEGITGYTYPSGNKEALLDAIQKAIALKHTISQEKFDRAAMSHMQTWDQPAAQLVAVAQEIIRKKQDQPQAPTKRRGKR